MLWALSTDVILKHSHLLHDSPNQGNLVLVLNVLYYSSFKNKLLILNHKVLLYALWEKLTSSRKPEGLILRCSAVISTSAKWCKILLDHKSSVLHSLCTAVNDCTRLRAVRRWSRVVEEVKSIQHRVRVCGYCVDPLILPV